MTTDEFEKFRAVYIAETIQMQKQLLTWAREESMTQHGPDTTGPDVGSVDSGN